MSEQVADTVPVVSVGFLTARQRVVSASLGTDAPDAMALIALGWTPERYEAIERLPGITGLTVLLAHQAERMTLEGTPWVDVLPWLEVLAAEGGDARRVSAMIGALERTGWEDAMGRTGIPGRVEALAFAAGLTPEEALEAHAEGSLDPDVLRGVATMTGYRLPEAS